MSFEVGASRPLRALHRLPWGTEAERQPHEHDYRIEVVVERAGLDDRGVVCDLDVLRVGLDDVLARLEGRDLDEIRYLADDGREALLVPTGDIDRLSGALRQLAGDAPLRRRLGEAARRRALARPTWEDSAALFFTAIRNTLEP